MSKLKTLPEVAPGLLCDPADVVQVETWVNEGVKSVCVSTRYNSRRVYVDGMAVVALGMLVDCGRIANPSKLEGA